MIIRKYNRFKHIAILASALLLFNSSVLPVQAREDSNTASDTKRKLEIIELLDSANKALEKEDFRKAEEVANDILDIDPDNKIAKKLLIKSKELRSSVARSKPTPKSRRETKRTPAVKKGTDTSVKTDVTKHAGAETKKKGTSFGERLKSLFTSKKKEGSPVAAETKKEEPMAAAEVKTEKLESKEQVETAPKISDTKNVPAFNRIAWLFQPKEARGSAATSKDEKFDIFETVSSEKTSMGKNMKGLNVVEKVYKYDMVKEKNKTDSEKFLSLAKELYQEKQYEEARYYAKEAESSGVGNPETQELIDDIDKQEIFHRREQSEEAREKDIAEAEEKAKIDYFAENAPPKSWMDIVSEPFEKKKYELGDIRKDKIYTLDECIQLALSRSTRVKVAQGQVKLARMRVTKGRRELLPQINLKWEGSSGRIGANGRVRHYRGYKYQMEVKHTVFDGFEKWFAVRQAEVNQENVELELKKIESEVIEEVKKAYYNLDKALKAYEIQGRLKKEVNEFYDMAEKMNDQELIPEVEYLKIKAQNMQVDFEYMSSAEDISLAELILFQSLGLDPDESIKIKPVKKPGKFLSIGLENCYQLALANLPEFRMKWTVLEYYNYDRKMVKAKAWPTVEFNGNFGMAYENYEPLNEDGSDNVSDGSGPARTGRGLEPEWYAGVKTSVPFWGSTLEHNFVREQWAPTVSAFRGTQSSTNYITFKLLDKFEFFSEYEETLVGFERAKYEYAKAKQDLMLGVKEWYFKYKKSMIQMEIAKSQLEHQKRSVAVIEQKRRFGDTQISQILDELVKLAEYEYGVIQTDTDYYLALVGLNKSIGLPEYFKPEFENEEYELWKRETAAK